MAFLQPYPGICECCQEVSTIIDVPNQKVFKTCGLVKDERNVFRHVPCAEIKKCPLHNILIKEVVMVDVGAI